MATAAKKIAAPSNCPKCGGIIQATLVLEQYFTLENGEFQDQGDGPSDASVVQVRFYCENDCGSAFTSEQEAALDALMP